MPRQKAQAAAAPPPSDAPKTVDDAADGPPGNAAETVAETGPEPDAPLPDEPNAHESANARQDGNDAIQAEAAKASARGTEMEGICDEFKGKSLAECVAMQPPPKAFAINMSGTSYNRTEKGTLTFSRVKGKYMMYGEQEHAMPNKAKLKMWDAFARLPSSYLKPDPIDPDSIKCVFSPLKTAAGKKHIACVTWSDDDDQPVHVTSYDVSQSAVVVHTINHFDGATWFEPDMKDVRSAAKESAAWWALKTNPGTRAARAAEAAEAKREEAKREAAKREAAKEAKRAEQQEKAKKAADEGACTRHTHPVVTQRALRCTSTHTVACAPQPRTRAAQNSARSHKCARSFPASRLCTMHVFRMYVTHSRRAARMQLVPRATLRPDSLLSSASNRGRPISTATMGVIRTAKALRVTLNPTRGGGISSARMTMGGMRRRRPSRRNRNLPRLTIQSRSGRNSSTQRRSAPTGTTQRQVRRSGTIHSRRHHHSRSRRNPCRHLT
jgi:hypothetical protein